MLSLLYAVAQIADEHESIEKLKKLKSIMIFLAKKSITVLISLSRVPCAIHDVLPEAKLLCLLNVCNVM